MRVCVLISFFFLFFYFNVSNGKLNALIKDSCSVKVFNLLGFKLHSRIEIQVARGASCFFLFSVATQYHKVKN